MEHQYGVVEKGVTQTRKLVQHKMKMVVGL